MENENEIILNKNKLVLLSKLLKEVKNLLKEETNKEILIYRYRTQRRFLETLMSEGAIDIYIDKLKTTKEKLILKEQIKNEVEE